MFANEFLLAKSKNYRKLPKILLERFIRMITGFQLKATKAVLDLTAKEIANAIGIHQGTLVRLGLTSNLEFLKCNAKNIILLRKFFESRGILFPNENTLSLKTTITPIPITNQLTRFQLKAARVVSELTQEELSYYIKVSSSTISILEKFKNLEYIKSTKINIVLLKKYFEHLGIMFPNDFSISLTNKESSTFITKKLK